MDYLYLTNELIEFLPVNESEEEESECLVEVKDYLAEWRDIVPI